MPNEYFFNANGIELSYFETGTSSAEPLVMLHGGAWCWQEYLSLIPGLSQKWHVYALDLRGNGRSMWVPDTYRLQDFVDDNAQFLAHLNKPAILVGHSIGGVIALMLAAQCPEKVKALVIEDAPLTLENYRKLIDASRDMFGLWLNLKRSAQSEHELSQALADAYKDHPGLTNTWIRFFAGCLWQLDPTFFNALLNDFDGFTAGYDYKRILAKIDCPVLFLRGETGRGAVMTDEEISWLKNHCANVQFAPIEGVGHLLHLEDCGQKPVLTAILRFLENNQERQGQTP